MVGLTSAIKRMIGLEGHAIKATKINGNWSPKTPENIKLWFSNRSPSNSKYNNRRRAPIGAIYNIINEGVSKNRQRNNFEMQQEKMTNGHIDQHNGAKALPQG